MYRRYSDRASFLNVYIKEAHPQDEWKMDSNENEGICYRQPRTLAERVAIAKDFVNRFHVDIPMAVDPIDDPANKAYAGWPERIYIIDEAGAIVYKGKPGPFGFHPEEAEDWLARRFPDTPRPPSTDPDPPA